MTIVAAKIQEAEMLITQLEHFKGQWRRYDGKYHIFTSLPEQAADMLVEMLKEIKDLQEIIRNTPSNLGPST